jgi:hypothetical protein
MNDNIIRCVGTPPPGRYSCPRPATRWQIREWHSGPIRLDLCEAHHAQSVDRTDVSGHGRYGKAL